jgi:indole-3-glycerol phosphate synthase
MTMILDRIVAHKKDVLAKAKKRFNYNFLEGLIKISPHVKDFAFALKKDTGGRNSIIAEVKKASPSKGIIREQFFPVEIAREYEANGAAAISVLTEEKFFLGSLEYMKEIKQAVSLPVLRKDFLFDPYQMYEARAFGADAVLLIVAVLEKEQLQELQQAAQELSLSALVEVHTREELDTALSADSLIIGINNRNLNTFTTDIATTLELSNAIPDDRIVVSESGLKTIDDIIKLKDAGVDAFLIGESLMRAESPGKKLREFVG